MKKITFFIMAYFMFVSHFAFGQDDFENDVKKVFSTAIIDTVKSNKGKGEILFKDPSSMPSYFRTGDKVNKVFAIESARLFRNSPNLNALKMTIPLEKNYTMNISRVEIEKFYNVNLSSMKDNLERWRTDFIQKYDSKETRAKFAAKFVKVQ